MCADEIIFFFFRVSRLRVPVVTTVTYNILDIYIYRSGRIEQSSSIISFGSHRGHTSKVHYCCHIRRDRVTHTNDPSPLVVKNATHMHTRTHYTHSV